MRIRTSMWIWLPAAALLACASGSTAAMAQQPASAAAGNAAAREQLPEQQVLQVLNRLGYGPRPGDVARVRAMGVDRWLSLIHI